MKKIFVLYSAIVCVFLSSCSFESKEEKFQEAKQTIYSNLKEHYVGFDAMVERGFTEEAWEEVSDWNEAKELLDKCVYDTHLYITNHGEFTFRQKQFFDEDSIRSNDSAKTYYSRLTSNTYYIRCNSCSGTGYYSDFINSYGCSSDFIILDFRSNSGGGNYQQYLFFKNLKASNYKGTIFVTQDNWCYSAGEVWMMAYPFTDSLDIKLIGTHSGGMQIYGNCCEYEENELYFWLPSYSFESQLPPNYLGEGRGYEPDIWANKDNMKEILTGYGLDLTGIEFN